MYDKDWEVHLALNRPFDPIHWHIDDYLEQEDRDNRSKTPSSETSEQPEEKT